MHPIFARMGRLVAYLLAWLALGVLLDVVLTRQGLAWFDTLVFLLPLLLVYAFICLSAWYVCRAMPLATSSVKSVLAASALAATIAGGLWIAITEVWLSMLGSLPSFASVADLYDEQTPFLFSAAVLVFLLVLSVHYVLLAFEAVREAEHHQLQLQVLTRDAELRALRAQIDPHFLYNSLNSISALTTADPPGARRMCLLLGDFLKNTLKVSALDRIPMADELALIDGFLGIEQVRFGSRLRVERNVDEGALQCRVPPLVLQPLMENAVAHGIARLIEGGVVRLTIARRGDRVSIVVENPRDPDDAPARKGGVGLDNVRRRLAATFPGSARMDATATDDQFRVDIELPCVEHD
jgi:two-component system, LytTR family, sensor histidine kinase AlgZ